MITQVVAILILLSSFTSAEDKASKAPPKEGFSNYAKLETWARTSSFGGGYVKELFIGGRAVYYSNRSFTSGRETTQVIFFYKNKSGNILSFTTLPLHLGKSTIKVDPKSQTIIVEQISEVSMDIRYTLKLKQIPKL